MQLCLSHSVWCLIISFFIIRFFCCWVTAKQISSGERIFPRVKVSVWTLTASNVFNTSQQNTRMENIANTTYSLANRRRSTKLVNLIKMPNKCPSNECCPLSCLVFLGFLGSVFSGAICWFVGDSLAVELWGGYQLPHWYPTIPFSAVSGQTQWPNSTSGATYAELELRCTNTPKTYKTPVYMCLDTQVQKFHGFSFFGETHLVLFFIRDFYASG